MRRCVVVFLLVGCLGACASAGGERVQVEGIVPGFSLSTVRMRELTVSPTTASTSTTTTTTAHLRSGTDARSVVLPHPTYSQEAARGMVDVDWDAIANCETGGNWSMHGSYYSTGLGVMNQAVRENSSADAAARMLAGTSNREEEIAMAVRLREKHGLQSWGCGKQLYPGVY